MITQNALLGRASGSLSGVIAQTVYEKNVLRSRPLKVRDAKSTGQLYQRGKLQAAMFFLQPKLQIFKQYWKFHTVGKAIYNDVLSYLILYHAFLNSSEWMIESDNVYFSWGTLFTGVELFQDGILGNGTYMVELNINRTHPDALDTDILNVLFINDANNHHYLFKGSRLSQNASVSLLQLPREPGDRISYHIWMERANHSQFSQSYCANEFYTP